MRNNFLLKDVHTDIRMRDFRVTPATRELLKARATTPVYDGELFQLTAAGLAERATLAVDIDEGGTDLHWPRPVFPVYSKSGYVDISASDKVPLIIEENFLAAIGPNLQYVNDAVDDPAWIGAGFTVGASFVTPYVNDDGRCLYAPFVPTPHAANITGLPVVERRYNMGFVVGSEMVEGVTFYLVRFNVPGSLVDSYVAAP